MDANELQNRLKQFAYRIVKLTQALPKDYVSEIIIKQIIELHVEHKQKKHLFPRLV